MNYFLRYGAEVALFCSTQIKAIFYFRFLISTYLYFFERHVVACELRIWLYRVITGSYFYFIIVLLVFSVVVTRSKNVF